MTRVRSITMLATAALICGSTTARAQQKGFDVPAQSVTSAILALGHQADIQVIAPHKFTRGKAARAVHGAMSIDQALSTMLSGTGLVAKQTGPQSYLIIEASRRISDASVPVESAQDPVGRTQNADGEIVVTANKTPEPLKNVASSVTALSGRTLLRQGANKLEDFVAQTPGVSVDDDSAAGSLNHVTIRGVTTGVAGNPTVGFYVDDAQYGASAGIGASTLSPDLDPADIERVEVLRGPQGTLYGAGSMGGLIKYVTREPSIKEFSGHLQTGVIVGDAGASPGDVGYAFRGSVNVPLTDRLAIRVGAFAREDPGYIDDPAHGGKNVDKAHYYGGRAALLWTVDDTTKVSLTAMIQHQKSNGLSTVDISSTTFAPLTPDLEHSRSPGTEDLDLTAKVFAARVSHELGWAQLLSVTSWGRNDFLNHVDYTPSFGSLANAVYGVQAAVPLATGNNVRKFTQEMRLTSPIEQRFFWQAGLYYTSEHSSALQAASTVNPLTGAPIALPQAFYSSTVATIYREFAGYGTVGYRFTDQFDISVGGRYSHNKQNGAELDGGFLNGGTSLSTSASSGDAFTFLVTPRYRFSDDLMVYVRVASGYRPGGPNIGSAMYPAFGSDNLVNYEVGLKGDAFDKLASFDLSAFLIDWRKIQLGLVDANGLGYIGNAAKARSQGVEASTVIRPARGLQIAGNITYLDAHLASALAAPLTSIAADGDRLPSSARWSGSINPDYDFPLGEGWSGNIGASYRYVGDRLGAFQTIYNALPRLKLPAYYAFDLRAGLTYQRWTISAYARNITDKRGYSAGNGQGDVTTVTVTQPRTFGLSLNTDF